MLAVGVLLWKGGRWSGSVDERFVSVFQRMKKLEEWFD